MIEQEEAAEEVVCTHHMFKLFNNNFYFKHVYSFYCDNCSVVCRIYKTTFHSPAPYHIKRYTLMIGDTFWRQ